MDGVFSLCRATKNVSGEVTICVSPTRNGWGAGRSPFRISYWEADVQVWLVAAMTSGPSPPTLLGVACRCNKMF